MDKSLEARYLALYRECFPEDSEKCTEIMFGKLNACPLVYISEKGEMLSALRLVPKKLFYANSVTEIPHVVGLGTPVKYRHKGYAAALLKKTFALCREKGFPFITLYPFSHDFYRNFSFASLDQLLAKADVISLHCPLTENTHALINKESIARMKSGVILLNTARGPLLNEADVARALKNGKIGGLGTDVLAKEPPSASNPLLSAPNTIITPHMAWASVRSRQNIINLMAENIRRWRDGTPINVVNGVGKKKA